MNENNFNNDNENVEKSAVMTTEEFHRLLKENSDRQADARIENQEAYARIENEYTHAIDDIIEQENDALDEYRKARRAFLVGYDRSVPLLRQASHCIGCERCVSHCPQGIKIPSQLHKIDHYVEKLKRGDW